MVQASQGGFWHVNTKKAVQADQERARQREIEKAAKKAVGEALKKR